MIEMKLVSLILGMKNLHHQVNGHGAGVRVLLSGRKHHQRTCTSVGLGKTEESLIVMFLILRFWLSYWIF
jgi:hypothetical protein